MNQKRIDEMNQRIIDVCKKSKSHVQVLLENEE